MALRGKLEKQLQLLFAEAGLDIAKINKILAEHQSEVRNVLEKEKSKSPKIFAALNKNLRSGIENQRKAWEQLASKPPTIITPIPLWSAWEIGVTPIALVDSHIEASNNWARILYTRHSDGEDDIYVSFWFYWQNPSEYLAVLNAESDLLVQGWCQAVGSEQFLWGGDAVIDLSAKLFVYVGGARIESSRVPIKTLGAQGGDEILYWGTHTDSEGISGTYHMSCSNISVPAGEQVLFSVQFHAAYNLRHGSIDLDFDTDQNKSIMCPGLLINLLTAPPVIAT